MTTTQVHGHGAFERVVIVAIVLNTIVLVWSFADVAHEDLLEPIHVGFLLFFVGEILVRLHRTGWNLREFITGAGGRWNSFDSIIVAVSLLPLVASGMDTSLLRIARLARVTHSVRHVGHLRLTRFLPRLPHLKHRALND